MGNPKFHAILKELGDLHDIKNQDYANPETGDPLFNLREVARFGLPSSTGIWVRCTDKWCRFSNWYKKGVYAVASEKVEDTVKDLIVYLCLWLMEYRTEMKMESLKEGLSNDESGGFLKTRKFFIGEDRSGFDESLYERYQAQQKKIDESFGEENCK